MADDNLKKLIGNTPLLRLYNTEKYFALKSALYAKAEMFNLTGSIKDRPCYTILTEAEKCGAIKKGDYIVEATSGNMGISLAAIAKICGYKPVIVMPEGFSKERTELIAAYGAELIFTKKALGMKGAAEKAREISSRPGYYYTDQFNNKYNALAHYYGTAEELLNANINFGAFVAGIGSGGTIMGVGRRLKENIKDIGIFGVEPSESPVLKGGAAAPHKIQGIGANFIPANVDLTFIDGIKDVPSDAAIEYTKILCRIEGLLCGVSSGANYFAAINLAKEGFNNVVTVFPDGGLKYLSTGIYSGEL